MPFSFRRLGMPEVVLIESRAFPDRRGLFKECFSERGFAAGGVGARFVQDNFSRSARGVIRGLHYQAEPEAQAKVVSVLRGEIFDVAVDIRKGSPRYGRWVGELLSDGNHRALYVPEGFAHGFCVVSEHADVLYKVSNYYSPEHERGIAWDDPDVGIEWPVSDPVLNDKDSRSPALRDADNNFVFSG